MNSKTNVAVIGAGGHAKVVLDADLSAGLTVARVVDDRPKTALSLGVPILACPDQGCYQDWTKRPFRSRRRDISDMEKADVSHVPRHCWIPKLCPTDPILRSARQ